MLKKLVELKCVNIEKLIVEYSDKLNIDSNELRVLLKIVGLILDNGSFTESDLVASTGLSNSTVQTILASLLEKSYLNIEMKIVKGLGREEYTLDSLYQALEALINNEKLVSNSDTEDTIRFLESKLGRTLSSKEMEIVLSWKDDSFTLDDIKKSIETVEGKGLVLTVNRIEKGLFSVNKESPITDKINKLLHKN